MSDLSSCLSAFQKHLWWSPTSNAVFPVVAKDSPAKVNVTGSPNKKWLLAVAASGWLTSAYPVNLYHETHIKKRGYWLKWNSCLPALGSLQRQGLDVGQILTPAAKGEHSLSHLLFHWMGWRRARGPKTLLTEGRRIRRSSAPCTCASMDPHLVGSGWPSGSGRLVMLGAFCFRGAAGRATGSVQNRATMPATKISTSSFYQQGMHKMLPASSGELFTLPELRDWRHKQTSYLWKALSAYQKQWACPKQILANYAHGHVCVCVHVWVCERERERDRYTICMCTNKLYDIRNCI